MSMRLESSAFDDGESLPERHTCDGAGVSPPLNWSQIPSGTKSFVLMCRDPDAPSGTFSHWIAFDIPVDVTSLQEAIAPEAKRASFRQGRNDFGDIGYGAACPPPGHGTHHYHFDLWAIDVDRLEIGSSTDPALDEVRAEAEDHLLGEARLTGLYER